ncbi:MAG: hypothetical protein PHF00_10040 [Elusimicrobia bacterium]|nr:hypothetical protein [Elusimicrobiota bacterium]
MNPPEKNQGPLRPGVVAAILIAPAVAALGIFGFLVLRGCTGLFRTSPAKALFADKDAREEPAPAPRRPQGPSSSLEVLPWFAREAAAPEAQPAPERTQTRRQPQARPGPRSADSPGPARKLSEADASALAGAVGAYDDRKAFSIGARRGLLFKLGETLLRYPRVVAFGLDNDFVVKGFMSQERVRKNCGNVKTLADYLSNREDPGGISQGLACMRASLDTPGSTSAIFGSKLVRAVINQCPALDALVQDPALLGSVARANPDLVGLLTEPRFLPALVSAPEAMRVAQDVQGGLLPGARPDAP